MHWPASKQLPPYPLIDDTFQSHVFTFCCGSGLPPPGNCLASGPWCWGTCCWWVTSYPPLGRFGACGMGRVSAGSSQRFPSLRRRAPSRACCAASAERNRVVVSLLMPAFQRRALTHPSRGVMSFPWLRLWVEAEWTVKHGFDVRACGLMWTGWCPWRELSPSTTGLMPCRASYWKTQDRFLGHIIKNISPVAISSLKGTKSKNNALLSQEIICNVFFFFSSSSNLTHLLQNHTTCHIRAHSQGWVPWQHCLL